MQAATLPRGRDHTRHARQTAQIDDTNGSSSSSRRVVGRVGSRPHATPATSGIAPRR